jgi:hypothetical protein
MTARIEALIQPIQPYFGLNSLLLVFQLIFEVHVRVENVPN